MHATPGDIKSLRSSADKIADMLSVFADSTAGLRKAYLKQSILSFSNIDRAYPPKISRLVAKLIVIHGCNARSYHVALPTFPSMPHLIKNVCNRLAGDQVMAGFPSGANELECCTNMRFLQRNQTQERQVYCFPT